MTPARPLVDVSVIICAHTEERLRDLQAAISSVETQTVRPIETIVVIDHNPSLLERVSALAAGAMLVENAEPRGLSGARNTGIALALGKIVAFIDDDAVAAPDWLEKLVGWYKNPDVMGVGGSIAPMWAKGKPRWFPEEFNWVVGCTYKGMPRTAAPIRNLIGCNMSFRSDVFAAVGGFRGDLGRLGKYPAGCEETELCIRASQHWPHRTIIYEPGANVAHKVPPARGRASYFRARCYAEGLSKALVARHVGKHDGLASERTYATRTLPLGAANGAMQALLLQDITGIGRAAAIVAGLTFTMLGYVWGTANRKLVMLQTDTLKQTSLARGRA